MSPWGHRFAGGVGGEAGFTLIELLVAITIALVVTAAAATVLILAVRDQPRIADRSAQIQQGRTMVERISRELRQGDGIEDASSSGLRVHTYVSDAECGGSSSAMVPCWITYSCASTSCTRTPDGSAVQETVVSSVSDPEVFCYVPWDGSAACEAPSAVDPSYVAIRLEFPREDGAEAVTVADGVVLRNHHEVTGGG